jgi:hypothetical protein
MSIKGQKTICYLRLDILIKGLEPAPSAIRGEKSNKLPERTTILKFIIR